MACGPTQPLLWTGARWDLTVYFATVSELVSAYPTAGGMYFVTKHVVPEKHVPIWAWVVGWCNFLGQTAGVSSVAYSVSQMILACASMNSKFADGRYAYAPYVPTALRRIA